MAMSSPLWVAPTFLSRPSSNISRSITYKRCRSSASNFFSQSDMEQPLMKGQKLMEFPHLTAAHKDLMNDQGTSQGSLHIRRGLPSSHIDFVLASWLHLKVPTGSAMNITNLQAYLKSSTDVPHFQFELVQCSPTYFILFLDITPRKDLVLYPNYLKTFYEEAQLETLRQRLEQVPETKPYLSSSLYFRGVVSPTGILVSIKCEEVGGTDRCEEIIREHVSPIAHDVMVIWLEKYFSGATVGVTERAELEKRDLLVKTRAIEMDLSSSLPLQFGQEVANRVLSVIKGVLGV
ncbi:Red chlorophyll catabolite reductase [Citrus sinensis]|uniref:Red chlorophyll catabolite reductase n=1 Tax=Citrus sinensis TaxID=2711 RepID=A0ACB8J2N2_CITSI|nr:Red chlorophyll catabolite reductase [Citrus sinensis]